MQKDPIDSFTVLSMIPPFFLCPGCSHPSWSGICKSCNESLRRNSNILPSTTAGILGIAPLLYSLQSTHQLICHWKDHPGSLTKNLLFVMPDSLLLQLQRCSIDYIIPIPQSIKRSRKRGHASALEVACFFSKKLGIPIHAFLSLKTQENPKQASLSRWDRSFSPNPFEVSSLAFEDEEVRFRMEQCVFREKELTFLLVDDLITSGNTLKKAEETIHLLLPNCKIWGASLGFRPGKSL